MIEVLGEGESYYIKKKKEIANRLGFSDNDNDFVTI